MCLTSMLLRMNSLKALLFQRKLQRSISPDFLIVNEQEDKSAEHQKHAHVHMTGHLIFMLVRSVDMYFVKYLGEESNLLNGFPMHRDRVYLFSHGSTIKTQHGDALYYSDLIAEFNEELKTY